jgi:hypothetical protein
VINRASGFLNAEMGGHDPKTVGGTRAGLKLFLANRQALVQPHMVHWVALARKLMPPAGARLRADVTLTDAEKLFAEMGKADIGTHIPDDTCYARADVAAVAGERAGVQMYKVNFIATKGAVLNIATPNAPSGKVEWNYHVAPAVKVGGQIVVIDPSMFDRPVPVAQWTAAMHDPFGRLVVTGPDQTWHAGPILTGEARIAELARHLSIVAGLRSGYEPLRAHVLADK